MNWIERLKEMGKRKKSRVSEDITEDEEQQQQYHEDPDSSSSSINDKSLYEVCVLL